MFQRKLKYIFAAGVLTAFLAAAAMPSGATEEKAAAAVTLTPAVTTTPRPSSTASASVSASPSASASASAAPSPSVSPTQEPPMSVMNAPVQQKITKKGLIYEYTGTHANLIGCTKAAQSKTAIRIPAKICVQDIYYDVKMIDFEAFRGCRKLKNVMVGRYVTRIQYGAFQGCRKLGKVTFQGRKLNEVGDDAFRSTASGIRFVMPRSVRTKYKKLLKTSGPKRAVYKGI